MNGFSTFIRKIWSYLDLLCKDKKISILLIGLITFGCCSYVGLKKGIPIPIIHDEFSYLLAADTFASGRLTNPSHPMWKHFETFNVLQKPTYMSRYPPMQGIFLAIGQKFFGHPIWGVWLSMALMAAGICWMLQAWVPSRWALLGSLLVIFHPAIGVTSFWAQSYMGGAVAAIGGALVFGAIRRIDRNINIFNAIIMGLGITILLNSRPFEGSIALVPVIMLILYWTLKGKKEQRSLLIRFVIFPLLALGLLTALAMGTYNKKITGNAFIMPCMVYEQTYSSAPVFIWQKPRPLPDFNNEQMKIYNKGYTEATFLRYSRMNFLQIMWIRLNQWILPSVTANNLLSIPLLLSLCSLFSLNQWMVFVFSVLFLYLLFQSTLIWFYFHYAGPLIAPLIVILIYGFRMLFCLKLRKAPIGKILTISYIILFIFSGLIEMNRAPQAGYPWYKHRLKIISSLNAIGGKHLVLVKYTNPHHWVHYEWVYNQADIDKSAVVWARDLGDPANQELLNYFKDRKVWKISVDE